MRERSRFIVGVHLLSESEQQQVCDYCDTYASTKPICIISEHIREYNTDYSVYWVHYDDDPYSNGLETIRRSFPTVPRITARRFLEEIRRHA